MSDIVDEENNITELINLFCNDKRKIIEVDSLHNSLETSLQSIVVENLGCLINSRENINQLTDTLSYIIDQLNQVNQWIGHYDRQLSSMQKYVTEINTENAALKIETTNRVKLVKLSIEMIQILDLPQSIEKSLKMSVEDMSAEGGLQNAILASQHLLKGLTYKFPDSISEMRSVREQRQKMHQLKVIFAKTVMLFFRHQFALRPKRQSVISTDGSIRILSRNELSHLNIFGRLNSMLPLMNWMHEIESIDKVKQIRTFYTKAMTEQYKRDIDLFFQHARFWIKQEPVIYKYIDLPAIRRSRKSSKKLLSILKALKAKTNIHKVTSFIFKACVQAISKEKRFSIKFLKISKKDANSLIETVFQTLENSIIQLINESNSASPFYLIYILVHSQMYIDDNLPFIRLLMNKIQIHAKQLFNKYVDDAINDMKDSTVKRGILPHMKKLPRFIDHIEQYSTDNSRSIIEPYYQKVILSIFSKLNNKNIQKDTEIKYTKYILNYDNYYFFIKEMEKRKIQALQEYIDKAKQRFDENLNLFINYLLHKYFSGLLDFFNSIDEMIDSGTSPEEVSYKNGYTIKDFSKIIQKYGNTVEKKTAQVIKKMNSIHPENSSILKTLNSTFKKQLLSKYKHWEQISKKCYNQQLPIPRENISILL